MKCCFWWFSLSILFWTRVNIKCFLLQLFEMLIDGTSQTQNRKPFIYCSYPVIIIITKYANKMQKYRRPRHFSRPKIHNSFYGVDFIMKRLSMSLGYNTHVAAAWTVFFCILPSAHRIPVNISVHHMHLRKLAMSSFRKYQASTANKI